VAPSVRSELLSAWNDWERGSRREKGVVAAGSKNCWLQDKRSSSLIGQVNSLSESFADGPTIFEEDGKSVRLLRVATQHVLLDGNGRGPLKLFVDLNGAYIQPTKGANRHEFHELQSVVYGTESPIFLQDTRDHVAVHRAGISKSLNMLMADGSVRTLYDENNDGYINPGPNLEEVTYVNNRQRTLENVGYTNDQCEVSPGDLYNGPVLDLEVLLKRSFEEN
jgi:prepilin-type processing-associated H-X9-DG protein